MILVDTSIWIDHLHRSDDALVELLLADSVCVHPMVVEELALGSLSDRDQFLATVGGLPSSEVVVHRDVLTFVAASELWGKGLSAVDAQLLASAFHSAGEVKLWTRDKKLRAAAEALDIAYRVASSGSLGE